MARPWQEAISRDELDALLAMSDWRSWLSVAFNWTIVGVAMAVVAVWPNPLTVIAALFVIGARQLGFAVLMHEAAHRSLFRNRAVNDWVGNWLCAYPVWGDLVPYRPYHLQHHAKNWTPDDPDQPLATAFPVPRRSLVRKIWRDLSGSDRVEARQGDADRFSGQFCLPVSPPISQSEKAPWWKDRR